MIKCEGIWKLAKAFSTNQHPVDILPSSSKRLLSKALVLVGSATFGDNDKDNYIQLVRLVDTLCGQCQGLGLYMLA